MQFLVRKTSGDLTKEDIAKLLPANASPSFCRLALGGGLWGSELLQVEISTLSELLLLMDLFDERLVIEKEDGQYILEIYDNYRE